MDHETREMFGNIMGLLENMKKDINVIKQDLSRMNPRQEGTGTIPLKTDLEESPPQSKVLEGKKSSCPPVSDQLKMSRLK